jgi:hypothetical protein
MLALGVGDQMGNLVAPFWFVFGVAAFTFLPC